MRKAILFFVAWLASVNLAAAAVVGPVQGDNATPSGTCRSYAPRVVATGANAGKVYCCIGYVPGSSDGTWTECSAGGGHTIADEGTARPEQPTLNFVGAGVSCVDNAGASRTDCTIPGGGAADFGGIGTGTNTTATMTVGSGATLDVQGGTLRTENLNAVRFADQYATSGAGTSGDPWAGWWNALATNTTVRVPKGYYRFNDQSGGGIIQIPAGSTILCDDGAVFTWSAARVVYTDAFQIGQTAHNVTIRGCAFEPGITVPAVGLANTSEGSHYFIVGGSGSEANVQNVRFEQNRFGIARYDTQGGAHIRFYGVDGLYIVGNSFDAGKDCIDNNNGSGSVVNPYRPKHVHIIGNRFAFSQVDEDFGGVLQLGTGLTAGTGGETIGTGLVVANNTFENVNGVLYLNHRWDGVTVSGNVARSDLMDWFMLPGVCSPVSQCSTASTAVTITGNTIQSDTNPGDGTVVTTGSGGIKLNASGGATISNNTILGEGRIEISAYESAVVPDWAKGPYTITGNTVNRIDRTTSDVATGGCVFAQDLSDSLIANNVCVNTGQWGIRTAQNSRAPTNVSIANNLIIDRNGSSIYASGVDLNSCVKCSATGNLFRGPIPSSGVVTGATADDVVAWNTIDPALSSVSPHAIGPGTNNDIRLRFDQGTTLGSGAVDPDLVWDDNPGQFEFDFTGTLNDGDPKITSSGFVGALTGTASGNLTTSSIDTSAELAAILGDETGTGGGFVRADGPTFGNTGATFGTALGETKTDVVTLPQWGQIRFEVPNLDDATGSTAFRIGSNYVIVGTCSGGANNGLACTVQGQCPDGTCVGTHDNALGIYYNASGGMAKINSTEWAFGQFIETNWDQAGDGSDNWLEYNWDFIPKATTNGWRPWYWVLDTNERSGDGAVITWAVNTFRSSANNAILVKYDTATGAYGSTIDFNYSADVTGAGKTRAHYGLFTSEEQADAYAFSAARMDKGTGTTSHARLYGAFQALVSLNSSTASHDYGYGRANRSEVEIIGSGANQHSESLVAFSGKVTVNPSTGTNVDAVAGLEVEFGTVKDQAGIADTLWGARLLGLTTNFTNQIQNTSRGGLYVGDQRCRAADTSNCAAIFIDTQNNNDGSSGNLAFNGGDYNSGHITFRNGWVHLYNSGDATYSFNSAALRLTRGLNPAALASRSGGLVATSNGNTAASAASITIEDGDHWVQPTGSTNVDTLNTCDTANKGKQVVVICGAYTGTLNDATGNLHLAGNLTCTSNDTLSLVCDGTNWLETSRSVN